MDITPQCVVALTWTLKDTLGEVLDELDSPVEFLVGGTDLLPRIEQALQGHAKGARLQLSLEPQDAFGGRARCSRKGWKRACWLKPAPCRQAPPPCPLTASTP